jgi:hypothetical protein
MTTTIFLTETKTLARAEPLERRFIIGPSIHYLGHDVERLIGTRHQEHVPHTDS